jgi:hypothetical protein
MNTISIETENRPLAEWLPREDSEEVVYLTRGGRTKFVVVPLDEGDEEVLAMQRNDKLMGHIAALVQRARTGPTKSLAQIKAEFSLDGDESNGHP